MTALRLLDDRLFERLELELRLLVVDVEGDGRVTDGDGRWLGAEIRGANDLVSTRGAGCRLRLMEGVRVAERFELDGETLVGPRTGGE